METQSSIIMPIVNANCAGIDVGSRSHYVAVGQELSDVREFGVYAEDLVNLCEWLKSQGITSVAMESTGTYWQNLHVELLRHGFEVVLANGKFTRQAKGKKTDVKDSRWIQKLHALGLLEGSFLPDERTEILRTYCRQRGNWLDLAAESSNKMQKFLRLLNMRLDVVVKDVCGLTGLKIIRDICAGNLDAERLSEHRHHNCKKSKEEIAKALKGNGRTDYLFGLKQELESYDFYQSKIAACDAEIDKFLRTEIRQDEKKKGLKASDKKYKRTNKNAPKMDINQLSFQYFDGVDILEIEGISYSTVLTLMSELGPDGIQAFPSAHHFSSWLRLAPNNKITGKKVFNSRIPRGSNRIKVALRQAANVIGNLKEGDLAPFFKRIALRKGRSAAINATARKIAVIIYQMLTKRQAYQPSEKYLMLDEKRKQKIVARIRKDITTFGISKDEIALA